MGTWPVNADEFYIAKATTFVTQHGFPLFANGAIYERGLLFVYIEFLTTTLLGFSEFSLRLPAVVFNLLTIPALFLLARKRAGTEASLLLIAIFALSVWETEFSRFARFYTAIQCIFVWFLWLFHEHFVAGRKNLGLWIYGLAIAAVFVHESAVFLALLLFVPFLVPAMCIVSPWRHFVFSMCVMGTNLLISWYGVHEMLFATLDLVGPPASFSTFISPDLSLIRSVTASGSIWAGLYVGLAVGGFLCIREIFEAKGEQWQYKLTLSALVFLALLQLFGLVTILLSFGILSGIVKPGRALRTRVGRWGLAVLSGAFVYWATFGLISSEWHHMAGIDGTNSATKLIAILLHYPRIGDTVVYEWIAVLPRLVAVTILFILIHLFLKLFYRSSIRTEFTLVIMLVLISMLGVINTLLYTTRYSFILYPIVLLFWVEVASRLAAALPLGGIALPRLKPFLLSMPLILFLTTEDASFSHLWKIDSAEVNFRIDISEGAEEHYLVRTDFRGPAMYINSVFSDGDAIVSSMLPVSLYLEHAGYVCCGGQGWSWIRASAGNGEVRERWTDQPLISGVDELLDILEASEGATWIIEGREPWQHVDWASDPGILDHYDRELAMTSIDERIDVYRLEKRSGQVRSGGTDVFTGPFAIWKP